MFITNRPSDVGKKSDPKMACCDFWISISVPKQIILVNNTSPSPGKSPPGMDKIVSGESIEAGVVLISEVGNVSVNEQNNRYL